MDDLAQFRLIAEFDGQILKKTVESWAQRKAQLAADSETRRKISGLDKVDRRGGRRILPDPFASPQDGPGDVAAAQEA
jgi:hypothetical protein